MPITLQDMKRVHQLIFETNFDEVMSEQFFYSITNPVIVKSVVNEVCRYASKLRDECIVH